MNKLNEHLWSGIIHRSETGEFRNEDKCETQRRLDNGEDPKDIFDKIRDLESGFKDVVIIDDLYFKHNVLDTEKNRLIWQKDQSLWFGCIFSTDKEFWRVGNEMRNKYNLLDKKGNLLSDIWFAGIDNFSKHDIAEVVINHKSSSKYNYIDTKGKLVWDKPEDEWFDEVVEYNDGFIRVKRNERYNFIDLDGNLLWNKPDNEWFADATRFIDGYSIVYQKNEFKYLDTQGNLYNEKP